MEVLGRSLTADETCEVTHMARMLAALVLIEEELNRTYLAATAQMWPWPGAE